MRRTRFMSLLFLVWTITFLIISDFRQGLQSAFLGLNLWKHTELIERWGTLPRATLEEAARRAEQAPRDARTLAFVAMHAGDAQERMRLADEAVAIDPGLTWVYSSVFAFVQEPGHFNPELEPLVARLEAWDKENAFPYLLEAELVHARRASEFPQFANLDLLAKETEWRSAMQKAFTAPRYDDYAAKRFELERTWLHQRDLDTPAVVVWSCASYPIPSLLNLRLYLNLLLKKLGKEAEGAGRLEEATGYYWTGAHMGERLQTRGVTLIEQFMGATLQTESYARLIPLLRRSGRNEEATTLENIQRDVGEHLDTARGKDPIAHSSNYNWASLMVSLLAAFVIVFGLLTALCMVYVNLKRWVRPEIKGPVYQAITVAENYASMLLFLACLGLYVAYYPYARNFHYYMTTTGDIHNLEPIFYNVLPAYDILPGNLSLTIGSPFRPYIWFALGGLVIVGVVLWVLGRRGSEAKP